MRMPSGAGANPVARRHLCVKEANMRSAVEVALAIVIVWVGVELVRIGLLLRELARLRREVGDDA